MIARARLLSELAVLAGLVAALAMLGPFGSYALPLATRLLRWAVYLGTGYLFFRPVIAAGSALARQTRLPRWLTIGAACAFGAFPTSMIFVFLQAGPAWQAVSGASLASAYLQTLIVGATVTIVQLLAQRAPAPPTAPSPAPAPVLAAPQPPVAPETEAPAREAADAPALLDLLPPHLRGRVLCLENEDHYVRVHTEHGSALLLMRMRDAVAQMQGQGERVHRSWWVARDAVIGTRRQDRNWKLRLSDGREVPVARATAPTLRALGWLDSPAGE